MVWQVDDQNGGHAITTTKVFPQGQWVHVAATVDDQGNGALYWDGQLVASGMLAVPPVAARANQYVGRSNWGSDSAFTGSLDEVKIWSGARTAAEIQQDMSQITSGSEPGLEAYYSFDEGSGTTAHDATANHRDATLAANGGNIPTWFLAPAIDPGADGVTYNAAAPRRGPNNLQNYPIVVSTPDARKRGWLAGSLPDAVYHLEFFAGAGAAQAETYLGSLEVTTDSSGQAIFDVPFTPPVGEQVISATATDPSGNTSELSQPRRQISLEVAQSLFHSRDVVPIVFSAALGSAIAVNDPDLDPVPTIEFTVSASVGTVTLAGTAGLSGAGDGSATLDYKGTGADLSAALEGMQFEPPPGFSGLVTLNLVVQAQGQSPLASELTLEYGPFFVTTTADSRPGSLRQAIIDANADPGLDTIDFAIAGGGVQTIVPITPLPAITDAVLIDGFSQPGYGGTPLIELSGRSAGDGDGLTITASGTTIRGLAIDDYFGAGISITGPAATGNVIETNFIGTDPTGSQARPNGLGISISGGAHANTIGGTASAGNLITRNAGSGVVITGDPSAGNRIVGNRIFANGHTTPTPQGALSFDGSGWVSLPDDLIHSFENAETIEAWFRTTSGGVIIGYQGGPGPYQPSGWVLPLYVGTDGKLYGGFAGWSQISSTESVADGRWHHAALTVDAAAGLLSLHLDGQLIQALPGTLSDFAGQTNQIGTGYTSSWPGGNGGWYPFVGQIDEVRIWSEVRSASDIEQDMTTAASGTEPGLEAYYRFEEGHGTTAFDATAHHRDGTLTNFNPPSALWVTASVQAIDLGAPSIFPGGHEALQFDGSGGYVQLPSFSLGGAFTAKAWVESENVHANWARIIDFGDDVWHNSIALTWVADSGLMRLYWYDAGGTAYAITTSDVFPQGQWVHVAATIDSQGNAAIYWDGKQVAAGSTGVPPVIARTNQYLARSEYPSDSAFSGALTEFEIWSDARTPDQIQSDMTSAPAGTEPDLLVYYPFDEGQGNIAHDASSHHHDAALATNGGNLPMRVLAPPIDHGADGVTYNGPAPRRGPNDLENYPIVVDTEGGCIRGWLSGLPASAFHLEFFTSAAHSPSGSGDAEVLVATADVMSDGSGVATFDVAYTPIVGKLWISATATDSEGDTSEVSPVRRVRLSGFSPLFRFRDVGPAIFSTATGRALSLVDPDAGPVATIAELTLSVSGGTLTLSGTAGLSGTGDGTGLLQYRGSVADLNAALDGLRFDPPQAIASVVTLTAAFDVPGLEETHTATSLIRSGPWLVTTTSDSGEDSLRWAIDQADADPGLDRIAFVIPGTGVQVIAPASPLPAITDAVSIDATTQPGYAGSPLIEISGQAAGPADGLTITGPDTTVRGLAIDGFASGAAILISGPGATGNVIAANVLGDDPAGSQAPPNDFGIRIVGGAHDNIVGGIGPGDGNVIAGNAGSGVVVTSDDSVGNRIEGNRIFDDGRVTPTPDGKLQFDGSNYVRLPDDLIHSLQNAETIEAWFQTSSGGVILGYQTAASPGYPGSDWVPALYVGSDGKLYGGFAGWGQINTDSSVADGRWHHAVLAVDSGAGTLSLYLDGQLVSTLSGSLSDFPGTINQVGTGYTDGWPDASGCWYGFKGQIDAVRIWSVVRSASEVLADMTTAVSSAEPGLEAYYPVDLSKAWAGQGIDLGGDGATANAAAPRQGPNHLQNYPVIFTAVDGRLRGWLGGSLPDSAFHIEFFASASSGAGGSGDAEVALGSLDVTTDGAGEAVFDVPFTPPAAKPFVTATATDPGGDTSELTSLRDVAVQVPRAFVRFAAGSTLNLSSAIGQPIALEDPGAAPLDPAWDLSLSVTAGTLALATTVGLDGTGNGTASLHYRGGLIELNAALTGLSFTSDPTSHGKVILTIIAGSTGARPLESQVTLADGLYSVTTTADGGDGSLRQAITDAIATPGSSKIMFAIAAPGLHTIATASALPYLPAELLIDATTQPGYSGTPLILLDGQAAGAADGLTIMRPGITVRGLAIGGFASGAGILINGPAATGTSIHANFIGTDPQSSEPRSNGTGIRIEGNARDNTIGGTTAGAGNLIADNSVSGIVVADTGTVGNSILGNRIFANRDENTDGLNFDGSEDVKFAPTSADPFAVSTELTIEASIYPTGPGVAPTFAPSGGVVVNKEGSYELTRWADGTIQFAVGNSNPGWNWVNTRYVAPANTWTSLALVYDPGNSTAVLYANGQQVSSTFATGPVQQPSPLTDLNIGNRQDFQEGFQGRIADVRIWNTVRTPDQLQLDSSAPPSGTEPGLLADYRLNEARGSSIHDFSMNEFDATFVDVGTNQPVPITRIPVAIDLNGDGVTDNAQSVRQGPNNLQNYPIVLSTADGRLRGWLGGSLPNSHYRVELFASAGYERGGTGEAQVFLGSLDVKTDGAGQAIFDVPFTPPP
jgi:hypothetical protein